MNKRQFINYYRVIIKGYASFNPMLLLRLFIVNVSGNHNPMISLKSFTLYGSVFISDLLYIQWIGSYPERIRRFERVDDMQ